MNISSVVVRAHPDKVATVEHALAAMPGVEIHAVTGEARIAATLEDTSAGRAADTYIDLHQIPGVLAVTLIYQYDDANEGISVPPGLFNAITDETADAAHTAEASATASDDPISSESKLLNLEEVQP